jgi:hypothetical protein
MDNRGKSFDNLPPKGPGPEGAPAGMNPEDQKNATVQRAEGPQEASAPNPEGIAVFAPKRVDPYTQAYLEGLGYERLVFTDREEGKAFLADAEALGNPFQEVDRGFTDSVAAWKKPDNSIWVESDSRPEAGDWRDDWRSSYRLALRVPAGREDAVLLDDHGTLAMPKEGPPPLYGMEQGAYATFAFKENGDLQIQATREFYEEFDAVRCGRTGTDDLLHDVLEDFRGNGWTVVDCHSMDGGAFSITNDGGDLLPDGKTVGYYPHAWDHTAYVTEDPIRDGLFKNGFVDFNRNTPADFLSQPEIDAWKEETNRQMLKSGDWEPDQCWELEGLSPEQVAETMTEAMAKAFHVCAWADAREERGMHFPPQTKIDQVAPETSEEAKAHAQQIAKQIVEMNKLSLFDLAQKAVAADTGKARPAISEDTAHELGWYMGMQSLGHGVSWMDDHADFGLELPLTEFYPDFTDEELKMR